MSATELAATNTNLWAICGVHDTPRDPATRVCAGCQADARRECLHCHGSGTVTWWGGGLEWPQACPYCREYWPTHLDPDEFTP